MADVTCSFPVPRNGGHPLIDLSNKLKARILAKQQRRSLARLLEKDSHTLRDIGLTHDDIAWTLAQPHSVDAQTELYRVAHLNGRRLM